MRAAGWAMVAVVAAAVAAVCLWGAFTRFDDAPPPAPGSPGFERYEESRYAQARLSTVLGLGAAFAFLAAAGCAQQAWRGRAGS